MNVLNIFIVDYIREDMFKMGSFENYFGFSFRFRAVEA